MGLKWADLTFGVSVFDTGMKEIYDVCVIKENL